MRREDIVGETTRGAARDIARMMMRDVMVQIRSTVGHTDITGMTHLTRAHPVVALRRKSKEKSLGQGVKGQSETLSLSVINWN